MHRLPPELKVEIPADRIAQYPAEKRDGSRILIYERTSRSVVHIGAFPDVVSYLENNLIILNNTRVVPALVDGRKPGGGAVSILFLVNPSEIESGIESLVTVKQDLKLKSLINPGRRLKTGTEITLPGNSTYYLFNKGQNGKWEGIWNNARGLGFAEWIEEIGKSPLPPYIRRAPETSDRTRYQTIYAAQTGSLAAPTAGLHITRDTLESLRQRNNTIEYITLDVGLGTFLPVNDDDLSRHKMHTETYNIPEKAANAIISAKTTGKPVTVVGTTCVRTLEDAGAKHDPIQPGSDSANIFIYPPYDYRIVDRLLTNFHRSDSTLIQLVAAMIGWDGVNLAYGTALKEGFRFYSYGDAMLVL